MFQKIVFFVILVVLAVIQVAVFPQFFPAGAIPNLILILVVSWTIRSGFGDNWKKIIIGGLILDLFYGWEIGINIISLSIVSFLIGSLIRRLSITQRGWGFIMAIGLVGLGVLINDTVLIMIIKIIDWVKKMPLEGSMVYPFSLRIILDAFLTALTAIFLYLPLEKLELFVDSYYSKQFTKTRFLK